MKDAYAALPSFFSFQHHSDVPEAVKTYKKNYTAQSLINKI
jgi:hypothetical protein